MKDRIATLEAKDVLTDSHRSCESARCWRLCVVSSRHTTTKIVAGLESIEEAALEQVVFDKHQRKAMEFICHLEDLLVKPQPNAPTPGSTNNRSVDKNLDPLGNLVQTTVLPEIFVEQNFRG